MFDIDKINDDEELLKIDSIDNFTDSELEDYQQSQYLAEYSNSESYY